MENARDTLLRVHYTRIQQPLFSASQLNQLTRLNTLTPLAAQPPSETDGGAARIFLRFQRTLLAKCGEPVGI